MIDLLLTKSQPNGRGKCIPPTEAVAGHEPVVTAVLRATLLKVLLTLEPRAVMEVMHTTTIRASITAYSTAVGPSSLRKNARTACATLYMDANPLRFA